MHDPRLDRREGAGLDASPRYDLILLDDDDHTYEYVIEMLGAIYGHEFEAALKMARTVDSTGRVIVYTGPLEHAQRYRTKILAYGADPRLERSTGSMRAIVEPAE